MISPVPAECSAGTKYKKEYWKDIQDKKNQESITAENNTKKTEDRIYRGLPFFHCYDSSYSSYSSSSDSSPSLSSPEEFSLLSS